MNLQEVAGGKKFLELLLEVVNFTSYCLIRRTLLLATFYEAKANLPNISIHLPKCNHLFHTVFNFLFAQFQWWRETILLLLQFGTTILNSNYSSTFLLGAMPLHINTDFNRKTKTVPLHREV